MKPLYCLLGLAGTSLAFNVNQFVNQAISQIYKKRADGMDIVINPYFNMTCATKNAKSMTKTFCRGFSGISDHQQNSFTRMMVFKPASKSLKVKNVDSGNTAYWWGSKYYMPTGLEAVKFKIVETLKADWRNMAKANAVWKREGSLAEWDCSGIIDAKLKEAGIVDGQYSIKAVIRGGMKIPKDFPKEFNPFGFRTTDWNIKPEATAALACPKKPFGQDCEFSAKLKGFAGKTKLDHAIDYRVAGPMHYTVVVKFKKFVHKVWLGVSRDQKFIESYYKNVAGKVLLYDGKKQLVFRLPFMGSFNAIITEAMAMYEPFRAYGVAAFTNDLSTAAHAVVWVDKRIALMENEFNCAKLVAATGVESDLLGMHLRWGTTPYETGAIQVGLQRYCKAGNDWVIGFLKGPASREIAGARGYVHNLTGKAGRDAYVKWFAKSFPKRTITVQASA